jgi:HEAT repeat protein
MSASLRVLGASLRVLGASLRVLGASLIVLGALPIVQPAGAQGRFTNVQSETRSAAQGLEREIRTAGARPGVVWVGYRMPMIAGQRQMCCDDTLGDSVSCCGACRLESGSGVTMRTGSAVDRGSRVALELSTEFLVLVRLEGSVVNRLRLFTPDCDVDAGGMPVVWLTDVKPEESVAWLSSLATAAAAATAATPPRGAGSDRERVVRQAIGALALHNTPGADRALEALVAQDRPEWLREDTAFWLGSARGESGARVLVRMIQQDPSDRVREKAAFGLSVSQAPTALPALIAAAKADNSARVRGQALFWLAQKAGKDAAGAITDAIERDPETEVKKRAVFALSRLPKDEGVPRLIEVAKNNRNPEVRKQAFFWLGQSKDPRAVQFFEEILLGK